eukprot:TRINITY_DN37367_c0_g1_i1.p1 TRINITY_DN37367_c0_g1~~TRINITY_DN37367_c0_g1_i1.p1  ORF type:complete len:572 (+),score=102.65 TRINITY_DN37367_c0_g1_i1:71-1786(+)
MSITCLHVLLVLAVAPLQAAHVPHNVQVSFTQGDAEPKAVIKPNLSSNESVEVTVDHQALEKAFGKDEEGNKVGPVVKNESKFKRFGYAQHPKAEDRLRWRDLRSTIAGRKCSVEKDDGKCGDLACRNGFCDYCKEDDECPSLYRCIETNKGRGKNICQFMKEKAWETVASSHSELACTLLLLIAAALAAAAGTGGGSIFVPVLISFSYLKESSIVALSQFMILLGSIVNLSVVVVRRHPEFPELPLIDYDCVVVLIPMLCTGVTCGVLVNRMAPSWVLLVLLCTTLSLALWRTSKKGMKQLHQERAAIMQRQESEESKAPHDDEPTAVMSCGDVLSELVQAKSEQILGILLVWLLMLVSSLHGLPYCSYSYGIFLCVMVSILSIVGLAMTWRFQSTSYLNPIDWLSHSEDRHPMTFPLVAFFTGFLGAMLGLGGGTLLGPVFIEVGMHSEAVQATTAVFVFLSSSIAAIQYFMMDQIVWHYGLWYGAVTVLATMLGQYACEVFIRRAKRYSFITLAVSAILLFSLLCLSVVGTSTVYKDYEMGKTIWFSTARICDSGRGTIIQSEVALPA